MNIADLFKKKTVFSFEVFPPKKESGVETIYKTLEELKQLNPDFISVTYGAGGVGVANATTVDLCSKIKNEYGIENIAHLTCLYNTKEDIDRILEELKEKGIDNILALRGDVNPNFELKHDFRYASELTEYIMSKNMGFNVSGGCYPEVHQEAESMIACLVQAADAISAARPGARRETLETYTNRLKQLEDISNSFKGVDKSFAIQAGREVRVMVIPDQINDDEMVLLARDLSKQIEAELQYPGQIKVNVIRESRVVDYAK